MAKKITIDDLAVMVNKGFAEMASKQDLSDFAKEIRRVFATKDDLRESEKRIRRDLESLDFKIASAASSWNKDFERIHSWVMELDERLTKVEAKSAKSK